MILRVNDTPRHKLSMRLCVNWDSEKITIEVEHWHKGTGEVNRVVFLASDFDKAIAKYDELVSRYY